MTKKVIFTERLMRPIAHFSHASRVGNVVHVGATAGVLPNLQLAGESPGRIDNIAQTKKMFENLETALALMGAGFADVVRLKTYVAYPRDTKKYLDIYANHFATIRPAHTVVGSWDFPLPQAAIELDVIAVRGGANKSLSSNGLAAFDGCAVAGVIADGFYYATALPVDAQGNVAAPACRDQAIAALRNLDAMLTAAGLTPSDVVNLHLTLADIRYLASVESQLRAFFGDRLPTFTVAGAPLENPKFLLTIEIVGFKGGGQRVGTKIKPFTKGQPAPAIVAGDLLFLSGQTWKPGDKPDVESQTRAAWQSLYGLIEAAGFHQDSLIRTNNILTDWRDYAEFNAGYGANMREPYVPRATVLATLPGDGSRVQIEGLAHRRGADATILQVDRAINT
jgi:enamine deaminase RidA (YjgF/YER057c/UK114 family)